jgi:type II secretory pathway pseudopilin PulG
MGWRPITNWFQKEETMKWVAIGIAVGALLAVAGFSIESLVGIVMLIIAGAVTATVVVVSQNRANRRARVLELRMLNTLNQNVR